MHVPTMYILQVMKYYLNNMADFLQKTYQIRNYLTENSR